MSRQPYMLINDVRYVERKPRAIAGNPNDCEQCAFANDLVGCHAAITGKAEKAFGADCEARDTIYVRVPA